MVANSSETESKPDIDYVLVDFEPLHKQRWRTDTVRLVCAQFPPYTRCLWHQHLKYGIYVVMAPLDVVEQPYGQEPRPLVQDKGAVFCRDHTKDKLIHVATTSELPAFLVEVELLKEKADIVPNDSLPLHTGKGVELLNNEPECRVYRFTLQDGGDDDEAVAEISLELHTEAVLLVLDDCEVEITNESAEKQESTVRQLSLHVGDDVHLTAGKFGVKLKSSGVKKTQFVLAEVY
ncbi:Argininosuccinate lyase [Phytophthora cinnamomi]|uniref:Argininosuccinate lyase n=1 Tax=Phytophthora cinnamomi TaxID=4785 RepID=UPI0035598C0E|nr:Argininosuccinate lyase [Phytophthora cinnamomi]